MMSCVLAVGRRVFSEGRFEVCDEGAFAGSGVGCGTGSGGRIVCTGGNFDSVDGVIRVCCLEG